MLKLAFLTLASLASAAAAPARNAAPCIVEVSPAATPSVAEEVRAADACRAARSGFADLFGDPVPPVRVVLWDRPGYRTGLDGDTAVVFWPSGRAADDRAADPAMLPHEIAHVLVAGRFYGRADDPSGGYGTPLADWLEEGVAIWVEPGWQREARIARARALPPERRDLATILASPHPASDRPSLLAIRDGAAPPSSRALWDFYPQSIAVLSFVHDRGGAVAVRALVRRLMADPSDPRGLAGLPGMPRHREGVLRAWERWVAEPAGP